MTERELRNKVVTVAQSWLGVKEGSLQHQMIVDTYNSRKPLPRGYKVKYTDAWCATFAGAVAIKAGVTAVVPIECGCGELIKLAQKMGAWVEDDKHVPQPGDFVLYDWQDDKKNYAVTDNNGSPDHVGVVEVVKGNTITVIEGNMSGSPDYVGRRQLQVNGLYIRGFICPKYGSIATKTPAEVTVENAVKDIGLASPDYWLEVLEGQRTASAANVKSLMDKYHQAVKAAQR